MLLLSGSCFLVYRRQKSLLQVYLVSIDIAPLLIQPTKKLQFCWFVVWLLSK